MLLYYEMSIRIHNFSTFSFINFLVYVIYHNPFPVADQQPYMEAASSRRWCGDGTAGIGLGVLWGTRTRLGDQVGPQEGTAL